MYAPLEVGLGGSTETGQIIGGSGAAAGMTVGLIVGGPVGAAIGAGIGLVTQVLTGLFGHGCPECEQTTHIVDQVEPLLKQNLAAYMASPRTYADQRAALANFDYAWQGVVKACSNPQFGDAGRNCISERQPGGQWDWFAYYRDPIANDPGVQPDPVSSFTSGVESGIESVFQPGAGSPLPLLLMGGLLIWAVAS